MLWLLLIPAFLVLLSPLETIQVARREGVPPPDGARPVQSTGPFVVYLSGAAAYSSDFLSGRERSFLERLHRRIPEMVLIDDVFPYSVSNRSLGSDRYLGWFWRFLQRSRLRKPGALWDIPILLRNTVATWVSADPRYGPVYNRAVARTMADRLLAQGFTAGGRVTLVAYCGGSLIGVAAAPYLKEMLGAEVRVVSLGGIYSADPGITAVSEALDYRGERDRLVPALGWLLVPGRWPPGPPIIVPFGMAASAFGPAAPSLISARAITSLTKPTCQTEPFWWTEWPSSFQDLFRATVYNHYRPTDRGERKC